VGLKGKLPTSSAHRRPVEAHQCFPDGGLRGVHAATMLAGMVLAQPEQPDVPRSSRPAEAGRTRRALFGARIRQLVHAIRGGDDASIENAVLQLSQSKRYLAPLGLVVGAFVMLFEGLKLMFTEWRLLLVGVPPAVWIWAAMLDLKVHVVKGRDLRYWDGSFAYLLVSIIVLLSVGAFYFNTVFAFAVSRPGGPSVRTAFSAVRQHIPVLFGVGATVGLALGVSTVVVPRWGLWWFSFSLSVVVAVMMLTYVAVPSRLVGVTSTASTRDKLAATAIAAAVSAIVCSPAYLVGRIGIVLLGTHTFFILGVVFLAAGLTAEAGATGAVKAIKTSAKLVAGQAPPAPSTTRGKPPRGT
jgi:hypothetical protein